VPYHPANTDCTRSCVQFCSPPLSLPELGHKDIPSIRCQPEDVDHEYTCRATTSNPLYPRDCCCCRQFERSKCSAGEEGSHSPSRILRLLSISVRSSLRPHVNLYCHSFSKQTRSPLPELGVAALQKACESIKALLPSKPISVHSPLLSSKQCPQWNELLSGEYKHSIEFCHFYLS
jgi:hypothetical protein